MFSYFSIEERIPAEHPLRAIKAQADSVLCSMSAAFDAMYAEGGRPSIAPRAAAEEQSPDRALLGPLRAALLRTARLQHAVSTPC